MTVLDFNTAKTMSQLEAEHRGRAVVDAEDIRARLHTDPKGFIDWLFSGRAFCTAREARIGDTSGQPGASLSIALSGPDAGLWRDHATGEGGDLISLYMLFRGYENGRNFQLALKEIAAEYFRDPVTVAPSSWQRTVREQIEEKKQALGTQPRQDLLDLGAPVATWKYYDTAGNVIASVIRYEPDGTPDSKTYRPFCFKTIEGRTKWLPGAPTLRPLYRLPEISLASTVVLVEGEKCADALISVGIEATTAMGGAEAPVEKTDWSVLHGKTVIVWPDNDPPGIAYGRRVAEHLAAIGCRVLLADIPAGKPAKWDAADCVGEGSDAHAIVSAAVPLASEPKPRIRILDIDELEALPPPSFLIDDVITDNGLSILWGRSGAMKSFAALDMGLCVSTGALWHGKATKAGLVIYVAAEGSYGLARRAVGWRQSRGKGLPKPAFKIVPHAIALTSTDLDALVTAILNLGDRPSLIIIDTLARTFGAGDENKQADMNAYVTAADRLREATGAHVMIIHHSGVHEDKRERGSNVLRGAADTVIKVERKDDKLQIINKSPQGKQKDSEEFETVNLRTAKVSYVANGTEQTTLILNLDEDPAASAPEGEGEATGQRLGKVEKSILSALSKTGEPRGLVWLETATGANKGTLHAALGRLVTKKLVEKLRSKDDSRDEWRPHEHNH